MHSHEFKSSKPYAGKRVLVIGGGNSTADVAVECSRVAARCCISMRRGHWFLPKFMFGWPGDVIYEKTAGWMPRWLRQKIEADSSNPTRIVTVRGGGYRFEG